MLKEMTEKMIGFEDLSFQEAYRVMQYIMQGKASDPEIASFLTALRMKGETTEEISGFAQAMLGIAHTLKSKHKLLVDTCGTGGDKKHTFNISTTAAFVAAGAGVAVAKHGNRCVSSNSGSADVLEELGVNLHLSDQQITHCIDDIGIGFIFARKAHAAMAHVARARKQMGIKTVFNILGPITNPAMAGGRVLGVYEPKLVEKMTHSLKKMGIKRALVVYGMEGLDEISVSGKTLISDLKNNRVSKYTITPGDFGLKQYSFQDLRGGSPQKNANILLGILSGSQKGAKRAAAVLNGAAAIIAGGKTDNFPQAVSMASYSIDSGKAMEKLEQLIAYCKRH